LRDAGKHGLKLKKFIPIAKDTPPLVLSELFHCQYSSEPEGEKTLLLFSRLCALSAGRMNAESPAITNKEN
jgi:hypothetical protein